MTPSDPVEVLPGISLKWKRPETAGLVIKNIDGVISLSANVKDLESNIVPDTVSLEYIHSGVNFRFKRLLFTLSPVSDRYIEHLTANIKRREALNKTL